MAPWTLARFVTVVLVALALAHPVIAQADTVICKRNAITAELKCSKKLKTGDTVKVDWNIPLSKTMWTGTVESVADDGTVTIKITSIQKDPQGLFTVGQIITILVDSGTCSNLKIKGTGTSVVCLLALEGKEAKKGVAPDPAKVAKCGDKSDSAFAKAETKGGCFTTGDAETIQDEVEAFVGDLDSQLSVAIPNPCQADKLKAAAKKTQCLLALEAKELQKGTVPPADKVAKCETGLLSSFAKAEAKGGCSTTGDAAAIEDTVDAFVTEIDAELGFSSPSGAFVE